MRNMSWAVISCYPRAVGVNLLMLIRLGTNAAETNYPTLIVIGRRQFKWFQEGFILNNIQGAVACFTVCYCLASIFFLLV